jgi:hypothetical protein
MKHLLKVRVKKPQKQRFQKKRRRRRYGIVRNKIFEKFRFGFAMLTIDINIFCDKNKFLELLFSQHDSISISISQKLRWVDWSNLLLPSIFYTEHNLPILYQ